MAPRIGLHEKLCSVLASFGVWFWDPFDFENDTIQEAIDREAKKHVYFEPPEGFKLSYPCIVYSLSRRDQTYANNNPYTLQKRYEVTVIDKDPDSMIPDRIAALPMCRFDRSYVSDNLHHDVFTIVY